MNAEPVQVGEMVRLAWHRRWLGPVIRFDGDDALVLCQDGWQRRYRRDLLSNTKWKAST